jgi:hypothetical protein
MVVTLHIVAVPSNFRMRFQIGGELLVLITKPKRNERR